MLQIGKLDDEYSSRLENPILSLDNLINFQDSKFCFFILIFIDFFKEFNELFFIKKYEFLSISIEENMCAG